MKLLVMITLLKDFPKPCLGRTDHKSCKSINIFLHRTFLDKLKLLKRNINDMASVGIKLNPWDENAYHRRHVSALSRQSQNLFK